MKIPEIPLIPKPESDEAKEASKFEWADPHIGKRHRLGGEPQWLQDDETPICSCGDTMSFYGQLDSIGDKYNLADCGLIYVFVCFGCFETKSLLQSG